MSLNALFSLEKLIQFLIATQTLAVNGNNGQRPSDIFPNFISPTLTGPIDFWNSSEGNSVYIFGLSGSFSASFGQLFSYTVASDVLDAAGVKAFNLSAMKLEQPQYLSADISVLARQTLIVRPGLDQTTKHRHRPGLRAQKGDSSAKKLNFWLDTARRSERVTATKITSSVDRTRSDTLIERSFLLVKRKVHFLKLPHWENNPDLPTDTVFCIRNANYEYINK